MKFTITYSKVQLHAVANYVFENNPYAGSWSLTVDTPYQMVEYIHNMMLRLARDNSAIILSNGVDKALNDTGWTSVCSTAGFCLLFSIDSCSDDMIGFGVDIFPDMTIVSPEKAYASEVIDL